MRPSVRRYLRHELGTSEATFNLLSLPRFKHAHARAAPSSVHAVTPDEVKALYAQFLTLKGEDAASVAALVISKAEFQAALGFGKGEESMFVSRIFDSFDVDKDGSITFEEFITGISILTPGAASDVRVKCV